MFQMDLRIPWHYRLVESAGDFHLKAGGLMSSHRARLSDRQSPHPFAMESALGNPGLWCQCWVNWLKSWINLNLDDLRYPFDVAWGRDVLPLSMFSVPIGWRIFRLVFKASSLSHVNNTSPGTRQGKAGHLKNKWHTTSYPSFMGENRWKRQIPLWCFSGPIYIRGSGTIEHPTQARSFPGFGWFRSPSMTCLGRLLMPWV